MFATFSPLSLGQPGAAPAWSLLLAGAVVVFRPVPLGMGRRPKAIFTPADPGCPAGRCSSRLPPGAKRPAGPSELLRVVQPACAGLPACASGGVDAPLAICGAGLHPLLRVGLHRRLCGQLCRPLPGFCWLVRSALQRRARTARAEKRLVAGLKSFAEPGGLVAGRSPLLQFRAGR